jgi:NitT/TauT family transport system permease protein
VSSVSAGQLPSRLGRWLRIASDPRLVSLAAFMILWSVGTLLSGADVLPGPWAVGARMAEILAGHGGLDTSPYLDFGVTLARILAATFFIMVFGAALGIAMGVSRSVENFFENLIVYWMALPVLLVVLLCIFWFGFNEFATCFATVIVIAPIAATNIWAATKTLNPDLSAMARTFHAGRVETVRHVLLPQIYPALFATFRSTFGMAWKVVAIIEAFFLQLGVGYALSYWFERSHIDLVLAWVGLFVIFILVIEHGIIGPIETRLFRWRPEWRA